MQYKVDSGLDVVVEAVDTTPSVPSFKQHTWSFLLSSHRLFTISLVKNTKCYLPKKVLPNDVEIIKLLATTC